MHITDRKEAKVCLLIGTKILHGGKGFVILEVSNADDIFGT